nr:unnamed protein product [Callosobruchus chinensis]
MQSKEGQFNSSVTRP